MKCGPKTGPVHIDFLPDTPLFISFLFSPINILDFQLMIGRQEACWYASILSAFYGKKIKDT